MTNQKMTLGEFIFNNQASFPYSTGELSKLLNAIRLASKIVNHEVNKAGLVDILGNAGNTNIQGENQQKLDVYANNIFIQTLIQRGIVCGIASEEEDTFIPVNSTNGNNENKYVVLIDPLDGSSNIDVNVSLGTIFSIYRRITPTGSPVELKDFTQPGKNQVAAGYIMYGTSTILVFSTGNGVNGFTLNPAIGTFYLSHSNMCFPENGNIYSINEGNYPYFSEEVKSYLKYCKDEGEGRPYKLRYIGSLVSDFHRNLLKGGIYMYPKTGVKKVPKLRLTYECNPIAYLTEQANGLAINSHERILDIIPKKLHQREAFFCGSKKMVEHMKHLLSKEGSNY